MSNKGEVSMWKFIPPRERVKFLVLIFVTIVLAGAMVATPLLYGPKSSPEERDVVHDADSAGTSEEDSTVPVQPEGQGPGLGQAEPPADGQQGAAELYDPAILDDVVDNTGNVTLEGLLLLIHWLQGMSHEEIIAKTDTDVFVDDLLADPAANRGKLVYVDGTLDKIYKRRLGTNSTGVETVYFGRMNHIGEETQPVGFYLLDGPLGSGIGEKVVLRGFFLSLWRPEGKNETLPIIVGRRFDKPDWLTDPESLAKVTEGSFLRERRAVYYLMEKVLGMTQDQLAKAADDTLTAAELASHGEQHRGKVVRYTGTIIHLEKETEPNPTGQCEFYTGFLLNKNNYVCMFYVVEPPVNVKMDDLVQLDGFFMKNYRYVSGESIEREASVIVGRRLVPVRLDASSVYLVIFGICGVALAGVLTAGLIETRAVQRRRREARTRSMQNRPGNIGEKARRAAHQARLAGRGGGVSEGNESR